MAPSHHLRSTLGKTRTTRRAIAAFSWALLLGGTLALSACGEQAADAAAIVDGTVISDKEVQNVSQQLNSLAQGEQKLSSSTVLLSLILEPYVTAAANRAGQSVADTEVLKVIEKVPDPSPATADFVRMQLALQKLSDASKAGILTEVGKAKITVNPRYGTFDAKQVALNPVSPNWIKAAAKAEAK